MTARQSTASKSAATLKKDPRYFDFDAAFAEEKPIPFRLLGRVWELPPDCDAATILQFQRLMVLVAQLEETGEVPEDMVIDEQLTMENMVRKMAGDQVFDQWLQLGIKYKMLGAVAQRLYAIYSGADPDGEAAAGKAVRAPQDRRSARTR